METKSFLGQQTAPSYFGTLTLTKFASNHSFSYPVLPQYTGLTHARFLEQVRQRIFFFV